MDGAGGETIREICRQSGAHVELNRDQSANSMERVFRIQGSPDQIRQAIQLVAEKAGIVSGANANGLFFLYLYYFTEGKQHSNR